MKGKIHILGPQRPTSNLTEVLNKQIPEGPVAVINAGWRHDEEDLDALNRDLKRPILHLPLYRWFDELGKIEPELAKKHALRQQAIKSYKKVYKLQLKAALDLWTKIEKLKKKDPEQFRIDEEDACAAVRITDKRAVERMNTIRTTFPELMQPWTHPSAKSYHERILKKLERSSALLITGGHVAILRNRMSFFGLKKAITEFLAAGKSVDAWSAGAMTLTDRIVLYYDDPPQGVGHPEVLDTGFGLIPGKIFLPHAAERLRLDRPERMIRFSRRFAPEQCICLENQAHFIYDKNSLKSHGNDDSGLAINSNGLMVKIEELI